MSGDEYEEYYEDAASNHSSSDHESPREYERYQEAQESRDDSSDHSNHSRSSSHSSKSHHSDEDRQEYPSYERREQIQGYERGHQPAEEPFYPGGEYPQSSHSDHSGGIPAGVTGAFGAMGLGGHGKHHEQPSSQHGAYVNDNQGYLGNDYRSGGDQYNKAVKLTTVLSHSGAGYVPQQQYQAPQPPYGQQYRGEDDGRPHQQHYGPTFTDPQTGEVAQAYFEYSRCSGTRKALLIGINYFGTKGELAGCINDVHNVQKFICERFGYRPADIVVLTDDVNDSRTLPTRENIIRGMQWLVQGAQRDDALFFHYSGHGTQTEDLDGDEGDDDDEAICPLDYESAGLIVDDDSDHEFMVKPLPAGCRLTAIFDSCHSGTVMDLPYVYSTEGKIKEPNLLVEAKEGLLGAGMDVLRGDTGGIMSNLFGAAKNVFEAKKADEKTKKTKTSPADIIQWAGCKDDQTSADTQEEGKATGAMSYAFIAALTKYPNQNYQQLLVSVREEMRGKYSQKPQLSACHPIDTELEFVA
ncbi:uncharacterized protein I303_104080 [Kwoniella dejecticola CBS 10117]|uniref:Peptidase C14 caspase domain-containing protein n=1 Tax=Kwoniella dejecticola CBS 10117 TaxID=1296121 RepID=A0A1A6A8J5_9TREE|nr:uncharacterized protein I303_04099 [Kwoniella dejecticola CBS 10117]OBR86375.1 hypothetical protein I303_04099 [Kwoniella dejecticola CBS 10117]